MEEEQTQLEYECDECAEYIMMRLGASEPTEENISMWIHDHFSKEGNYYD